MMDCRCDRFPLALSSITVHVFKRSTHFPYLTHTLKTQTWRRWGKIYWAVLRRLHVMQELDIYRFSTVYEFSMWHAGKETGELKSRSSCEMITILCCTNEKHTNRTKPLSGQDKVRKLQSWRWGGEWRGTATGVMKSQCKQNSAGKEHWNSLWLPIKL